MTLPSHEWVGPGVVRAIHCFQLFSNKWVEARVSEFYYSLFIQQPISLTLWASLSKEMITCFTRDYKGRQMPEWLMTLPVQRWKNNENKFKCVHKRILQIYSILPNRIQSTCWVGTHSFILDQSRQKEPETLLKAILTTDD